MSSLSDIPLAFAIVYLAPGTAIAARLIGCIAVFVLVFRLPLYKVILNIGMFSFEVVLAFVVFRGVLGSTGPGDTQVVVAAILATAVCGLVSFIVVSVAIAQFEGGLWSRVSNQLKVTWWLDIVNAAVGGMVLGLALISPYLVLIALVPVGVLWYVIKAFGAVEQQLHDLDAVHGFTGQVGQSLDPDEIMWAAVAQTALLLRTDGTAIVLFKDGEPSIRKVHGIVGVELPSDADDESWQQMIESERAMLVSGALLDRVRTFGSKASEMMVAPIRDGSGVIGLLVVAGRTGAGKRFGNDDVVRLQNLTEQLTASLRRGMLHQRIEREAHHDLLTGLPNRLSFERSAVDAAAAKSGDHLFVIMLDLDRFKEVNDTLGHHAGDQLLIETAARLRAVLAPSDVVARLAADEFAVVGKRGTREEMLELAWACVREVGRPVTLDGLEIVVTASAGLAVIDEDVEAGAPLRFADIAMFNAKTQRSGVEVYRDEIDRRTPARLSMLGDLRTAIEEEQLYMHLQPKLDLSTGTVVGAEALVRWTHPARGHVPPVQFVRIAEDTGLIKQLTDLMLHRGISTLRDIHDRGYLLGLSVNLSTHDLLDRRLAERV
ncbi:MAG TPA: diguanylate cyclase, partial [Ilumatobacteraceae bacterium]|nr:diguanylate cyclase [Ilumatobacteraceae bacterium]